MNDTVEQERLRDAFRQGNGIVKLSGWEPKPADFALQERVIRGELTVDEAVKVVLSEPYP
jgi:hypothetical protein